MEASIVCVLENPEDLFNVGSIIRSMSAFGIYQLCLITENKDWQQCFEGSAEAKFGQKHTASQKIAKQLKKLSVGATSVVNVKCFNTTINCVEYLKSYAYVSYATSSHLESNVVYDVDFSMSGKIAIWFGTEKTGLSTEALSHCISCVQLPMSKSTLTESLNLACAATAVLSYISFSLTRRCKFKCTIGSTT
jgi:tRNA G18 (ribose-2'-O)-methylase SpoU